MAKKSKAADMAMPNVLAELAKKKYPKKREESNFEREIAGGEPHKSFYEDALDTDVEDTLFGSREEMLEEAKKMDSLELDASEKSEDTMSIIKHLQKNMPEAEEAPKEMEFEEDENDHPILKKKKKKKIFGSETADKPVEVTGSY